jgi:hypothetical protein
MTRGLYPPESLSKDDIESLHEVRKNVWVGGFQGFCAGFASGYLIHRAAVFANEKKWITASLSKNTKFATIMVLGSLGSFVGATTTGKNTVHTLHPVFQKGKQSQHHNSSAHSDSDQNYKRSLQRAKERNDDLRELERSRLARNASKTRENAVIFADDEAARTDRLELERNRILRRASLNSSLKAGHGLSDSHGGHWVQDDFRK